jgi:hypothetical protein
VIVVILIAVDVETTTWFRPVEGAPLQPFFCGGDALIAVVAVILPLVDDHTMSTTATPTFDKTTTRTMADVDVCL